MQTKAWQLLEDKSRWCQRATFLDSEGKACGPDRAQRYCIIGALSVIYTDEKVYNDAVFRVRQVVTKYTRLHLNLVEFNDNYSHDKIVTALKECDV